MTHDLVEEVLRSNKILPILVIDDIENANPTIQSIEEGGLNCLEITLRTDVGLQAISRCVSNFQNIVVGAGTVLSPLQATQAIEVGAQFIVSPGFDSSVMECANSLNIPYFPGTATATEIQRALAEGLKLVKFFPAEQIGGLNLISAISSALSEVEFLPTGGIDEGNFLKYLQHPKVACVGGSWLATRSDIREQNLDGIKQKVSEARSLLKASGL